MQTDAALDRFRAALDAAYGATGARFVVWEAPDHDGDPAVYVRIVLPDSDARFVHFADRLAMRQKVNHEAAAAGLSDLVYTSFRSDVEEKAEEAELVRLA